MSTAPGTPKKRNVLIVDDSRSLRLIVRHHLEAMARFNLFEACDGEEAETLIQQQAVFEDPIELVMLDWMMPKLTGFELLQRLRSVPRFQEWPKVIMLTAETYPEQVARCSNFGISSYLTKPFTPQELAEALRRAFGDEEFPNAL